jgi:S1-C subfamily serine protease
MFVKKTHLLSLIALLSSFTFSGPASAQGELSERGALRLQQRFVQIAKEASPKTVCVIGVAGSGTGAVISADGLVVTNAHVAAASRYAVLLFSNGRKLLAQRQGIDYGRDLAFLKLVKKPEGALPFFQLAEKNPEFGSWIGAIGYPGGPRSNAAPTFSIGVVRKGSGPGAVNGMLNYSDAITSDAPLFPGNSGGPMVDMQGRLAGINGAVNLQGTASYSIPIQRVRQRMKELRQGLVMLPGGQKIDTNKNFLAKALFKLIDPNVRKMMEQRINGSAPKLPGAGAVPAIPDFVESDELSSRAFKTPRVQQLNNALKTAKGVASRISLRIVDAKGKTTSFATAVTRRYAVAVASRLGNRKSVTIAGLGAAKVVSVDPGQNIALLQLPKAARTTKWRWAAPVGTLVLSGGKRTVPGALSVQARPVNGRQSAAMAQSGGFPAPIQKAMTSIKKIAKTLKIKAIEDLIDQMLQSTEAKGAYMRGNAPRGFRSVISHDSPLAPSHVGTPLLDAQGRLLGVNVSNAHFGTSYTVSINDLVRSFPVINGGKMPAKPRRPSSQSKGKRELY